MYVCRNFKSGHVYVMRVVLLLQEAFTDIAGYECRSSTLSKGELIWVLRRSVNAGICTLYSLHEYGTRPV